MAAAIIFFNQLCGGGALASFGGTTFAQAFGSSKADILKGFAYLNLLQVVVTLFSGQFL
jgi:hypothetical protein